MGEKKRNELARAKTASEVEGHFRNQWNRLVRSCLAFDNGDEWEGAYIASPLAILCNDGAHRSLLTQLGYRERFSARMLDTGGGDIDARNMVVDHRLVGINSAGHYIVFLDDSPRKDWIKFGTWWSNNKVARFPSPNLSYSRADIIRTVRNQEGGGGHVDPTTDELVDRLGERDARVWTRVVNGVESPMQGNLLWASVRQIGHEFIRSIEQYSPQLIEACEPYPAHLVPDYGDPGDGGGVLFGGMTFSEGPI